MPRLIPVSIIKKKWLMSRKRNYPIEGGSRGDGNCRGQCCLGLSRTENYGMLVSSWHGEEEPVPSRHPKVRRKLKSGVRRNKHSNKDLF
jgi:hypothetical protein